MNPYREPGPGSEPPRKVISVSTCPHGYFLQYSWVCRECFGQKQRDQDALLRYQRTTTKIGWWFAFIWLTAVYVGVALVAQGSC